MGQGNKVKGSKIKGQEFKWSRIKIKGSRGHEVKGSRINSDGYLRAFCVSVFPFFFPSILFIAASVGKTVKTNRFMFF